MIFIGKSPYRVSLLGGGSDLEWFVKEKGFGICFGFSLNQYSYSIVNVLPENAKTGMLEYSTREIYSNINDIVHPIVREVLNELKISRYIELKTFGFASGGSGLGGSASFILSLLNALSSAFKINLKDNELIEKSCFIEINKLKKPIGKQDQYLCANKGFNSFTFLENGNVEKNKLSMQKLNTLKRLADNFYLIPTNKKRNAEIILSGIKNDINSSEQILEIRTIASQFLSLEEERDFKIEEFFHKAVHESWVFKKSMLGVMTSSLDEQYEQIKKLIPNNWIRLLGAGNGGYFLISSKIDQSEINKISNQSGIRGIFKATPSKEGLISLEV